MAGSFLQRLVHVLFGKQDATSASRAPTSASAKGDVGAGDAARSSVASGSGATKWFRKARFVAPGDTLHHPSAVSIDATGGTSMDVGERSSG